MEAAAAPVEVVAAAAVAVVGRLVAAVGTCWAGILRQLLGLAAFDLVGEGEQTGLAEKEVRLEQRP